MKNTEKVWNGDQSWNYESLHVVAYDQKIKIKIKRNAYDNQSWSKAYLFDGNKWNTIVETPHPLMKCLGISYVQKEVKAEKFYEDEKILLEEVKILIG